MTFDEQFKKFWSVVWRKVGKLEAERKFKQALKREPAEVIIKAAEVYAESVKDRNDRSWLPHPATWLHKGRYYDELEDDQTFDPLKALNEMDNTDVTH
jgi:hypothetical protein